MTYTRVGKLRCGKTARFNDYHDSGWEFPLMGEIVGWAGGPDSWKQDGRWNYSGEHPLDIVSQSKALKETVKA